MANYQIQRGTYDAYYGDSMNIEKVIEILKGVAATYGYTPIHIPVYEQTELFTRSVGESSDIVNKEMFTFQDKGNRSITLRPEFTAGVMRAIVTNKLYANTDLPLKFFYYGPVFRYERPGLGRYRQFNQFGIECVGINSPYHDVEVITLGYNSLKMLGFPHVVLKINTLGDDASRNAYKEALKAYFSDKIENMCEDCKRRYEQNPLRILDCKVKEDQELVKDAPKMKDYLSQESLDYFNKTLDLLNQLEIEYEIDDTLVRGLDYYSHVVFEFHFISDNGTNLGAIGAGGHFDKLLNEVGGPNYASVGFAFGIERLNNLLKEIHPCCYEKPYLDVFVIYIGEEYKDYALDLTQGLRASGFKVDINYENKNVGAQFKIASRKNARTAIVIGEEEINKQKYKLKNMQNQEQVEVSNEKLLDTLDAWIERIEEEGEHDHE